MKNRVRAVIINENKILIIKRTIKDLVYFVFPGGGVDQGESLSEALKRECKEELGVGIKIIKKIYKTRFDKAEIKQLEHFYLCKISCGVLGTGDGPEYDENSSYDGTHELMWLNQCDLLTLDLRPNSIKDIVMNIKC